MNIENSQSGIDATGFVPLLTTKDWNEEWIELQHARRASDDASHWDKRAQTYNKPFGHSPYSRQFLDFSDIKEGETVFDMGCGTGAISVPLAQEGHEVCAADFSQGMLERLAEDAEKAKVSSLIKPLQMAWEDDWSSLGVAPKSFDVAVASRSVATNNIQEALLKLSRVARRKCAITLSAGSSPRSDQEILNDIGLQQFIGRDFLYAFMVLIKLGYMPEVRYISSCRYDSFDDDQEAFETLSKMVKDTSYIVPKPQIDKALENLREWVSENLAPNPNAGQVNKHGEVEKKLALKNPRKIIWAHISWNV